MGTCLDSKKMLNINIYINLLAKATQSDLRSYTEIRCKHHAGRVHKRWSLIRVGGRRKEHLIRHSRLIAEQQPRHGTDKTLDLCGMLWSLEGSRVR